MANTSRKSEAIPVKHGSEFERINPGPDLKMAYLSLHYRKWSARNAAVSRSDHFLQLERRPVPLLFCRPDMADL